MKKTLIFSLTFFFCFFIFSQTAESDNKNTAVSDSTVSENSSVLELDKSVENEMQQDVIVEISKKNEIAEQSKTEINLETKPNNEHDIKEDKNLQEVSIEKKQNEKIEKNIINPEKTEKIEDIESLPEEIQDSSELMIEPKQEINSEIESELVQEGEIQAEEPEPLKKIPLSIASEEILAREDVEKFRQQYLSPKWSALLHSYLESAMEYRLYVRQEIQQRNLPEILEYLPVVESNYKTKAKSYSGAVGMWQFMANSVYPFLTLNDFVDQRLDPWYSTDAGLSKLEDNFRYFGDWLIAIAAYNCGGGAMTKALKNAGVKDFWYLADNGYLPKQTVDYIPKLLAIADLAINSEYYGIDLPNHNEEFEILENEKNGIFDYVTVNKAYSINELAKELRIEQSTMEKLNASYILGITHPTKESKIRLPLGLAESAEEAIKKLTPIEYPFKYKVVSGDSLWSISRKYKVTVSEICELNNIKENDILSIGKILYIPSK